MEYIFFKLHLFAKIKTVGLVYNLKDHDLNWWKILAWRGVLKHVTAVMCDWHYSVGHTFFGLSSFPWISEDPNRPINAHIKCSIAIIFLGRNCSDGRYNRLVFHYTLIVVFELLIIYNTNREMNSWHKQFFLYECRQNQGKKNWSSWLAPN